MDELEDAAAGDARRGPGARPQRFQDDPRTVGARCRLRGRGRRRGSRPRAADGTWARAAGGADGRPDAADERDRGDQAHHQADARREGHRLDDVDLDEYVYGAVQAGASGFLLKHVSPGDLVHAVYAVAQGDTILAPSLTRRLLERFASRPLPGHRPERLKQLSDRETEVVTLVARGLTNSDISRQLFLSEATVKTYLSRVLTKLELRDRVQVAVLAYETGLVQPGSVDHPGV